jgi:3-oxoadipate enol-lactonase
VQSVLPSIEERWFRAEFRTECPEAVQAITSRFAATDPEGYVANCAAVRDADFRGQLTAIESPTLVLFGTHDPVTSEADAMSLKDGIRNGTCVGVNGAHLSNVDASEQWNAHFLNFLAR